MALAERYISVAGSGAHDGSSPSNEWTWNEFLLSTENRAGKRYNVKSGAYTSSTVETAGTATFVTSGGAPTAIAPMFIEGYASSPGDLRANGRTGFYGPLILTNFPTITYTGTGRLTLPDYTIFLCIDVSGNVNNALLTAGTSNKIWRARSINTNAGGGSTCINDGSNYISVDDCDVTCANGGSAGAIIILRGFITNCRITGSRTGMELSGVGGAAIDNQVFDAVNAIVHSGLMGLIRGNSMQNISGSCIQVSGTDCDVTDNIGWGSGGGSSRFLENLTSAKPVYRNTNFIGNMGAVDSNPGDWLDYNDVALSVNPFTSSTDMTLNTAITGGALVRGAGIGKYRDGGAIQSQPGPVGQQCM